MKWHPISYLQPLGAEPVTALVVSRDEEGEFYTCGIYLWRKGQWVSEDGFLPLKVESDCQYWYVFEEDFLLTLPEAKLHAEAKKAIRA